MTGEAIRKVAVMLRENLKFRSHNISVCLQLLFAFLYKVNKLCP